MWQYIKTQLLDAKIERKLTRFIFVLITSIFLSFGISLYLYQKNNYILQTEDRMQVHLQDLRDMLDLHIESKQQLVDISLNFAQDFYQRKGGISIADGQLKLNAINQITKNIHQQQLDIWKIGEDVVHQNHQFVDSIQKIVGGTATLFQKIPQGYLRISTNVRKLNGERAINTYIPNDSPVIQTIEKGKVYHGRAFVVSDWYITAYMPLRIKGEIQGILYVGVREKELKELQNRLAEKKYFNTGQAYLMSGTSGQILVHPNLDLVGRNIKDLQPEFFEYTQKTREGKFSYRELGANKWEYFTYYEPYDMLISIILPEADFLGTPLAQIRNVVIIGFLISLLVSFGLINIISKRLTNPIKKITEALKSLAKGQKVSKLKLDSKDEMGEMSNSMNQLITALKNYREFAEEIGKGNLDAELVSLGQEDVIGRALIEMQYNLQTAAEDERIRAWQSNGLAKFGLLLRDNIHNDKTLADRLLGQLIEYIGVEQGALFIANKNEEQVSLEMLACYAYERKKFFRQDLMPGEGLVGQCYLEKARIYLTEIPPNYTRIDTGLGNSEPRALLCVPMMINEEVFGVIEIASLRPLEEYKIKLVEEISVSIASTLASMRINEHTQKLLRESQKSAERLQQQEEEMRQNMEELQTTQEASQGQAQRIEQLLKEAQERELEVAKEKTEYQRKIKELEAQLLSKTT